MKLDLLYEVDCPKPWDGSHPQGRRRREQRAYREAKPPVPKEPLPPRTDPLARFVD